MHFRKGLCSTHDMRPSLSRRIRFARSAAAGVLLCASFQSYGAVPGVPPDASGAAVRDARAVRADTPDVAPLPAEQVRLLNRLTWGADEASARRLAQVGPDAFIAEQLQPGPVDLPPPVQAAIAAMQVARIPVVETVLSLRTQRDAISVAPAGEAREKMRDALNQEYLLLSREVRQKSLLRMIHSPRQLQEKMTWFWVNHFHIYAEKHDYTPPLMADYEENAIRPNALGKFRDLLAATVYHPAMLFYLDNVENGKGRRNENYARELLELHTLGADGGHQQADVIELSRVLTGLGVNTDGSARLKAERLKEASAALSDNPSPAALLSLARRHLAGAGPAETASGPKAPHVLHGLFEFDPARHDNEPKRLLGHEIAGSGLAEVDQVIDILARHPSTARHISRKLAVYFVSDDPPADLIEHLSRVFLDSDGDIAATLGALFASEAFRQSLGSDSFKDPMQHVLGAMRLVYGAGEPIVNAQPVANWLGEMGQALYQRQTPEGYPLERQAWQNSRQLLARFDMARPMAGTTPELFHPFHEKGDAPRREAPDRARLLYSGLLQNALSAPTRRALGKADSAHEWNMLLLSSPDFMSR